MGIKATNEPKKKAAPAKSDKGSRGGGLDGHRGDRGQGADGLAPDVPIHPDRAAFLELRPLIDAVPKERAITPYFSARDAATVSLRLFEAAAPHRELFVALDVHSPGVLGALIDLPKLARAYRYISSQLAAAQNDEGQARVPEVLVTEADALRSTMTRVLTYNFDEDPQIVTALDRIRQGLGHRDRADDLEALAMLYELNADTLAHDKVHYNPRHLVRARELSVQIGDLLDRANNGTAGEWARLRAKAAPLLLENYDRVMRTMIFIDFATAMDEYPKFHTAVRALQGPRSPKRPAEDDAPAPDEHAPEAPDAEPEDDSGSDPTPT